jgi:hypothetical protein
MLIWTFVNLVFRMYLRFINVANVHTPTNTYKTLQYLHITRVLDFANNIKFCGSQMVQPPTEYNKKRKFLNGIPSVIVYHPLTVCKLSAKLPAMSKLVKNTIVFTLGL